MTSRTVSLGVLALAALLVLSSVAGAAASAGAAGVSGPADDCVPAERTAADEVSDPAVWLVNDTMRVERGGTARITVELAGTDTGYLTIARNDSRHGKTLSLTDTDGDGEVTVRVNTSGADPYQDPVEARGADEVRRADGEHSLGLLHPLPRGEYDLRVAADRETLQNGPYDRATLHVEPRPTAGVRLWRLDSVASNASSETVRSAVSDENLSRPMTIGPDEWLVAEIDDARVEDVLANRSEPTPTERFVGAVADGQLRFGVEALDVRVPELPPQRLNLTVALAEDALVVMPKQRTDAYYVAVDTGSPVFDRGDYVTPNRPVRIGLPYRVTFSVLASGLSEADHPPTRAEFHTLEPSTSLDQNTWTFEAAENQSITGTTNFEPGTQVTVRIESQDPNNPLVDRERARVRENGTFAVQFDLSELPPRTNLSIRLSDPSGKAATATGRVVAHNESVALANDTVRVARGGTARVTVEMDGTDTGYLQIGREWSSDSATVRLRDVDGDGAVTVWFDTFAPIFDENVVGASGTDEASLAGGMESFRAGLLAGEYEITTATDSAAVPQNSSDRGTLNVTSGSTDGVRLWRLDGVGTNASSGAVESAISDRKFRQLTALWPAGWLVVSVDVPGLTEVVADRPEATPTERFTGALADGDVRVHAAQQESNIPQLPPKRLNVTKVLAEDALVVVPKQRTDGYYVALNATAPVLDRGANRDSDRFRRGEVYDLWIAVPDGPLTDAGAGGSARASFAIRDPSVSLERDFWTLEPTENQSITGTTDFEPGTEVTVRVESQDPTTPFVDSQRVRVQGNGTFAAQFDLSELPPGTNLSIRVSDPEWAADAASGTVIAEDESVTLADDTVSVARGDVTSIRVRMTGTDTGYLAVDNFEYQAVIRLRDVDGDGAVTVRFNTFAAGRYDGVVGAGGADEASLVAGSETNLSSLLARGEYGLGVAVSREAALMDPEDEATLRVTPRSTDGMQLWRLNGVEPNASSETVRSAVLSGNLSRPETIGPDEWLVAEIDASGVGGLLANRSESTVTERFVGAVADDELGFDVRQTAIGCTHCPEKRLNLTTALAEDALVVVPKQGSDGYYVALDTGADVLDYGVDRSNSLDFGVHESYGVTFTLPQGNSTDARDGESVGAVFQTLEGISSLDQSTWTFESAANQSITGTANFEPGTQVTVRIESQDPNNPLVDRKRVQMQSDGTFEAQFNLSSLPPGTNVSIRLSDPSGVAATATGRVVASPATFSVSDLSAPSSAQIGDTVTVTATVTNTGDVEGTTPVEFVFAGQTLDSQNVTLAGGASTTVEFNVSVSDEVTPGQTYTHGITAGSSQVTAQITINEAPTVTPTQSPGTTAQPTTAQPTGTATATSGGDGGTTESGGGGQPGFGMGVAIVALLAAALLALRRRN